MNKTVRAYLGDQAGIDIRQSFVVTEPLVFACDNLWQHEQPLLDYLTSQYGHCRLDSLGGSYGWPVRYRQIEDYAGLNVTTLAEYIAAFQTGNVHLPYLRHLSVNRALPDVRHYLQEPAEFHPNWVRHPRLDRLGGPELFIGQTATVFGNVHQDQAGVHVGFVHASRITPTHRATGRSGYVAAVRLVAHYAKSERQRQLQRADHQRQQRSPCAVASSAGYSALGHAAMA